MADNVFIQGIANGVLKEAFSEIPLWATEKTANEIQNLLQKILKVQTDGSGKKSGSGLTAEEFLDDIAKMLESEKKREDERKDAWKEWKKDNLNLHTAVLALGTAFTQLGVEIRKTMIASVETFDQLYRAGINVTSGLDGAVDGFDSLRHMSVLTNIRFTELAKSITKYSEAVNAFGVGNFARTVGMTSKRLTQFGYSATESADLLGAYLEAQKGYTDVTAKSQTEINDGVVTFGKQMTRLSQATGIMRSKLIENVQAISHTVEANILQNRAGAAAAEETMKFVASMKDQNFGKQLLKMMTDPIKPLNNTFMAFQKTGFGGFGQKFISFTNSLKGLKAEEAAERLADFAKANDAVMQAMIQQGTIQSQAGNQAADEMLAMVTSIQQQGRTYKKQTDQEKAAADAAAKASAELRKQQEAFQAQFQKTLTASIPMLEYLTGALNFINAGIDGIRNFVGKWVDQSQVNAISFGIAVVTAIGSIAFLSGALKALASTIFSVRSGGKGGAGETGVGRGKGSASSDAGPSFLERLGSPKALMGVGVFIGMAGALYIAAKAMEAFGNVSWESMGKAAVTIGAVALAAAALGSPAVAPLITAGSIVLASLAGALAAVGLSLRIVGPGLTSLTQGLKDIGSLNGSNLINVATGIGMLSASLVALGAGSVVSGIGNLMSSFTDGFSKLIGGKTVIERLKEFAALGPGLMQTATAISAMNGGNLTGIGLPALTANGAGLARPAGLNSPSNVSTHASPANQLTAKEPTQAMGPGIEKASPDTGINSMISYQTSLLEQLLQSTNNLVSVNKDILKYTRVHS